MIDEMKKENAVKGSYRGSGDEGISDIKRCEAEWYRGRK